jgi:2-aminoadipate transaminase
VTRDALTDRLAARFRDVDTATLASEPAAQMLKTAGEWDPPKGVVPARPTLHLSVGIPDSATLPRAALNDAMQKVLAENGDASLRYGFGPGYYPLRAEIAHRYRLQHSLALDENWLQLTNGSSGAIDLVVRSLIDPGDVILCEAPVYMGTLRNFRGVRARVEPVPVDRDGLSIEALDETIAALERAGARIKLVYTISSFQNPTGATLSLERRRALLDRAARHGFLVLDDEAYADLYYDATPLPSLLALADGYGVVSVGTFSKTVATGLRCGWIMARPELIALFTRMRFDMGQNQMALRMLANFLASRVFEPHVAAMRALYRRKMNALADALEREAGAFLRFERPRGGFYLWTSLAPPLTADAVWRAAAEEGVAINPGVGFLPRPVGGEYLRIAFAWTPLEDIPEAARRIGIACRRAAAGDVPGAKEGAGLGG